MDIMEQQASMCEQKIKKHEADVCEGTKMLLDATKSGDIEAMMGILDEDPTLVNNTDS